ncbi:hypothetical protein R1flu_018203 [Riccia fluitans]|uniref:GDP-D-glucose phosphorylase 1 n=1 Tax=Riccia fluitans TaxID=41844 RepID=A0ABD1ZGF7_9MARC
MTTIKRVSTIVSINQNGDVNPNLPEGTLPLYRFAKRDTPQKVSGSALVISNHANSAPDSPRSEEETTCLDDLIFQEWIDREKKGLFRYRVADCKNKVLEGDSGFIAQLNEGRHLKKRATEFRIDEVLQPYDPKKFNFTKVDAREILFAFEENDDNSTEFLENGPIGESPNLVVINVSPIDFGHVLLVPKYKSQLPQRIDKESLLLALHMAVDVNNPHFRLGYNSLGAFASLNHLHFQAYYLFDTLPIERARTSRIFESRKAGGLKISELVDYPVKVIMYEVGESLKELADVVGEACIKLQTNNLPFNLLISYCGSRVFLIPQCYAEKQARGEVDQAFLDTEVNPAAWEISGHIVLKHREDFHAATEESVKNLLAQVSLSESHFSEVKTMCCAGLR